MKKNIRIAIIFLLITLFPLHCVEAAETPSVYARSAILIEIETGRVLYEKQADLKIPMASTTKIMTAMIVLERAKLDDIVTVSKKAASTEGSSMKLKEGEQLTVMGLLYGLMLKSGNDAAVALAEHVAGNIKDFCAIMNDKAKIIGANNTNFVTPHGLDHDNHYTTASDLALITCEALKNSTFREIIATKYITIDGHTLSNINNLLYANNGIDGVKTGFTQKAGRCIVITAERDGMRIVGVILGCNSKNERTSDGLKITNYAFNNYAMYTAGEKNASFGRISVKKGRIPYINAVIQEQIRIPLTEEEYKSLKYEVNLSNNLNSTVYKGDIVGQLTIWCRDEVLYAGSLYTDTTSKRKSCIDYSCEIFKKWLYPWG